MTQFTPYLIILPLFTLFLRFHTAAALPADRQNVPHHLQTRKISRLEEPEIDNAMRYVNLARSAFCPREELLSWTCESCKRTDYIHVLRVDGDGHGIPEFYVGYSPMTGEVIIAHAGTSSEHRKSIEINLWLGLAWICDKHGAFLDLDNEELMNCLDIVSHNVEVHIGYLSAHAATADVIRSLLLTHDGGLRPIEYMNKGHMVSALPSAITAVGYSMGGALATLDLVYLYNAMNPAYRDSTSLSWKLVTVGSPRIGNKEFAKFMSTMPFDVTRIINMGDPVPKLPPNKPLIRYANTPGRVLHVKSDQEWWECTDEDSNRQDKDGRCHDDSNPLGHAVNFGSGPHFNIGDVSMAIVCGRFAHLAGPLPGLHQPKIVSKGS